MTDRRCLLALVAIQLVVLVVIDPRGNFPLSDDWVYTHSVRWLLDEHRFRLSDWTTPNLLPQTLAGGIVSALFGLSFETLRHLTQAVAMLVSVTAYYWFRAAQLRPSQALAASIATIAMPCWPMLANSYMSDLYGLLFAIPAATLFLRALRAPSPRLLLTAASLAALGTLQRQVVIVVPFSFMVAWLFSQRGWTWRSIAIGCAPFALALGAALAYHAYLYFGPGVPTAQQSVQDRVLPMFMQAVTGADGAREWLLSNVLSMTGYLGLLFFGWAAWWGMGGAGRTTRAIVVGGGIALAFAALALTWLPPYREHFVIDAAGIGPFTLYDGVPRDLAPFDRTPGVIWRIAGIGAAFGAVAWIALVVTSAAHLLSEGRDATRERVFMLAVLVTYLGPFAVTDYFDRYLLFVLPFAIALWSLTWRASDGAFPRARKGIALGWIGAMLGVSALATHDNFAWNRARWQAIGIAESLGATPDTLDGGYEYNGFRSDETRVRTAGKSWWWVKDDRYIVAFSPLPGYRELRTLRVPHWLSRSPGEIRLLVRED